MGFFNNLAKLALDAIETPIAVVKDVATMAGALTDQDKPYTQQKLEDIGRDFDSMKKSFDEKR